MTSETLLPYERQGLETAKILLDVPDCVLVDFNKGFTLSSGIQSPIKVDCERLVEFEEHFEKILIRLENLVRETFADYRFLCGVITGGALIADALSQRLQVKSVHRLGNKRDKERMELVSGEIDKNDKGIIIEDVFTTGLNTMLCSKQVITEGGFHLGAVGVFNFGFKTARENIRNCGMHIWSLSNFDRLVKAGLELGRFNTSSVGTLQNWWRDTNDYLSHLLNQPQIDTIKS